MSDIKLFKIQKGIVKELEGRSVSVEISLQNQMESQLEIFLGVRVLASEYSTEKFLLWRPLLKSILMN